MVDRIAELEKLSFSDPWSHADFEQLTGNPNVLFLTAMYGCRIAGYLILLHAADAAELANLATDPELRRIGIGASLLDSALDFCHRHDIADIALEVRESNVPARALYTSRGFTEVSRRRAYYRHPREDAIVMVLNLL